MRNANGKEVDFVLEPLEEQGESHVNRANQHEANETLHPRCSAGFVAGGGLVLRTAVRAVGRLGVLLQASICSPSPRPVAAGERVWERERMRRGRQGRQLRPPGTQAMLV